ncbi:Cation-transporting P-type ATPase [Cinnamomum micranthum f. kanehirae]|uniref:Cation-transporting P-type ATPase n=1 Tax=Cinnamomum micranthum f. kanehirae TaxID=337451 RepID=A0A3S3MK61_9MAGN|nr:Cation-transporting P-type ATPase [Cinnamomum micranthum f. kanehirae]
MASDKTKAMKFQKSYFDVLGLCCSSEVPLIEKILSPLEGIEKISVIVPTRTVIVVHDNLLISQIQIVKALNQARLEANVRVFGEKKGRRMWPNPYTVASGVLLLLSTFKFLYHPLNWLALGGAVVGLPPILMRSIAAVRRFSLDINILMLIAVGGSIAMRDYWEAAFVVFLFTIAEWLESRASYKATAVMSMLMNMAPQTAILAENSQVVDAGDVKVNTIIAVKAGEVIPIDGIVVEGKSEVDERTLTGESFPVAKQIQSTVWAGTINLNGYLSVKTTALAEDSAVARMAKLVEEAQHNKSRTQRLIDKCAKYYTPAVILISTGLAVVPTAMRVHDVKHWYRLALVVLVSACPCALVLSTPVATYCALTKAASVGLLIKGGDFLESLAKIKIIAFDKTGTITRGEFTLIEFRSLSDDITIPTLLYWVSSIEIKSSHPMAAALVDYAHSNGVEPKPENVNEFQILPGEGIYGEIDGKSIYIGNKRIAARVGCETVPSLEGKKEGITAGYIFSEATPIGIFSLSDTCRTGVPEAINELKELGLKTAMLTGDSRGAAMHIQDQLGHAIGVVHAELLPEEKMTIIRQLKKEGSTAMVGDGMNDAPALATADVGISMGVAGSAVATETGHITLMSNDIRRIPQAIRLSRTTRRKIIENVALSVTTKAAILGLAFSGHPLLWAAILADVGTCLMVIFNSMFLLWGTSTKSPPASAAKSSHKHNHNHKHASDSCCASSTRVDHAKVTCGSVDCHLTHAHKRNCSQIGAPGMCQGETHGSCGSVDSRCTHVGRMNKASPTHVHEDEECNHDKHINIGDRAEEACANNKDTCGGLDSPCCGGMAAHANHASHEDSISIICETIDGIDRSEEARTCESMASVCCSHGTKKMEVKNVEGHGTCGEHTRGHERTDLITHACCGRASSSHVYNEMEKRGSKIATRGIMYVDP